MWELTMQRLVQTHKWSTRSRTKCDFSTGRWGGKHESNSWWAREQQKWDSKGENWSSEYGGQHEWNEVMHKSKFYYYCTNFAFLEVQIECNENVICHMPQVLVKNGMNVKEKVRKN